MNFVLSRAHGRSLDPAMHDDDPNKICSDEPGLAACYAAATRGVAASGDHAGLPPLRLLVSPHHPSSTRVVETAVARALVLTTDACRRESVA